MDLNLAENFTPTIFVTSSFEVKRLPQELQKGRRRKKVNFLLSFSIRSAVSKLVLSFAEIVEVNCSPECGTFKVKLILV